MVAAGAAAINTDGITMHTTLSIPVAKSGKKLSPLSGRNKLSDLEVIIIDEMSMISNDLLFHIKF